MALRLTQPDEKLVVADVDLATYDPGIVEVDDTVTFTVRRVTPSDVERLRAPYVKKVFDRRTHRPVEQPIEGEEARAMTDDLLDAILVDWSGIVIGDRPAPCDRAHKVLLDFRRKAALIQAAMASQVDREATKRDSFRPAPAVGPVVG